MKKFLMAAAALALVGSVAFAGPNAGGTIIVHNAQLTYPGPGQGFSGCGLGTPPASCESANTQIDGNDNHYWVWKVYAAFAPCSGPRLKAMDFGITYDQPVYVLDHGNCLGDPNNGAAELPGPGWPNSGTGTVLVWQYTQTTTLVEAYWFGGYSYYGAPAMFTLTGGRFGGMFADDSVPTLQDPIGGYGSLGFNQAGTVACPSAAAEGACCDANGNCTLTCENACTGTFMGAGTTCDPNPCTPPTGACCVGTTCYILSHHDCDAQNGTYHGDNVPCTDNLCNPVPTKIESWGQIKHSYR
jgi:hypothetical protein